jgi:GNAT superfamily N-acetyltransferase
MDDGGLYQRVRHCLRAELEFFAAGNGSRRWEAPGVFAAISPTTPDRSLFNGVMCDDAAALARHYDTLAHLYDDAGVRAWTVWIDGSDANSADWLGQRGHKLDSRPIAMGAVIDHMNLEAFDGLDWFETDDMALVARINDAAYGFPPPAFTALVHRNVARWRAYVARTTGEPRCCVLAYHAIDGDVGVSAVATLPVARGTGLATRLLSAALSRARADDMTTTTLQASPMGRGVYTRMGYRDLGEMQMWERRQPT